MNKIRQIARLNDLELAKAISPSASWHTDYRDTAYVHFSGIQIEPELSEGDVLTIFSQYGNPVHIHLKRDNDTGKSKGFGWLKYEDQRSCDLAVDNLGGAEVLGRKVAVDHARYKKAEGEVEGIPDDEEDGSGSDGGRKRRRIANGDEGSESESGSGEEREVLKEELQLAKLEREMEDEDPMKAFLVKEKKAEIEEVLGEMNTKKEKEKGRDMERKHRHRHRSGRDGEDEHRRRKHRSRRENDKDELDEARERRHQQYRSRRDVEDRGGDGGRTVHSSRKEDRSRSRSPYRKRRDARSGSDERSRDRDDERRERKTDRAADRSRSREPYRKTRP